MTVAKGTPLTKIDDGDEDHLIKVTRKECAKKIERLLNLNKTALGSNCESQS
jgi:hypothetical protein